MDFSTTPLSYLLLTLSAVTLLSAEGQFPNSATPAPDAYVYVTIRPRSTATPDACTIPGPEDVVTTALSVDVTTEPPSTTSTPATAAPVITELPFPIATPLKLVCPNATSDRFTSTLWYLSKPYIIKVYRIDAQGVVTRSNLYNILAGFNVTHNVTSTRDLIIDGDTCNHTATYECRKFAKVGQRNEVHSFSVTNCTVSMKVDHGPNSNNVATGNGPNGNNVATGNAPPPPISSTLILGVMLFISTH